jgi:pre-rRNA-processing protein TSR1
MIKLASETHAAGKEVGAPVTATFPQFKTKLTIYAAPRNFFAVLDIAKVADYVIWVLPLDEGTEDACDDEGDKYISAVKSQGLPTSLGVVTGVKGKKKRSTKQQKDLRKWSQRFFATEFGDNVKLLEEINSQHIIRTIAGMGSKPLSWRGARSYMLVENATFAPSQAGSKGTLTVCGYLRGQPLSANQLVHLTGKGTYQIGRVDVRREGGKQSAGQMQMGGASNVESSLLPDPAKQETLTAEANPDMLMGEQSIITDEELMASGWGGWKADEEELTEEEIARRAEVLQGEADRKKQEAFAAEEAAKKKKKKGIRRPKGMSEYQAAWLVDDDELKQSEINLGLRKEGDDDEMGDAADGEDAEEWVSDAEESEEESEDEDAEGLEDARKRMEDEDREFPDEVQVPEDGLAKIRFARYRGLQSFRNTFWDPNESLPAEYGKIFRFQDFLCTQKRVLAVADEANRLHEQQLKKGQAGAVLTLPSVEGEEGFEEGAGHDFVVHGSYVSIQIQGVEEGVLRDHRKGWPLLLSSLLKFENRLSVMHLSLQRVTAKCWTNGEVNPDAESGASTEAVGAVKAPPVWGSFRPMVNPQDEMLVVKSKDPHVAHVGFRRFRCKPSFSENNLNCDKHKFHRFMPTDGSFFSASIYAPITFGHAPAMLSVVSREELAQETPEEEEEEEKEEEEDMDMDGGAAAAAAAEPTIKGSQSIVASGSVLNVNPNRIMLKRIILTGYPVKTKKRTGTIKYMFDYPEDVSWFKPVELFTKWGLQGSIRESLGTHGLFKAYFTQTIQQNDTVCMPLYKRVFPKLVDFAYGTCNGAPTESEEEAAAAAKGK